MTIPSSEISIVTNKIAEILHPLDRELMGNIRLDEFIRIVKFDVGLIPPGEINLKNCITILVSGFIGVKHVFEDNSCISHFYHEGDVIYDTEIQLDFNELETKWHLYEPAVFYILALEGQQAEKHALLFAKLMVQSSLHSSYQYQSYINEFALDRKSFCVEWLRKYSKALGLISRKDLSIFFGISMSSLKTYIKIALQHAN